MNSTQNPTHRLLLLGTENCHLCEMAESLVTDFMQRGDKIMGVEKIDIALQERWQDRYAWKIPVLLHPESHQELAWPFDETTLVKFLNGLRHD